MLKRPLGLALLAVALVVTAGTFAWTTAVRDRDYRRLVAAGDAAVGADQTFVAIENYSGAIALKPDSMLAYLKRGETYRRLGDLNAALRDLRTASTLDPTAPRPLERLGDVLYAERRYGRAADRYNEYIRLDDRSPRLLYKLALARYQDGRADAAIPVLRQAIRLNDRYAEAYYLLGLCLQARRLNNEALWALQRAIRTAPALTAPREALAALFGTLGRSSERIEQLEALAALESGRVARQVDLALAYAASGRTELAVVTLGRAAERFPNDIAVYTALASIWLQPAETRGDHAALAKALEATRTIIARRSPTAQDLLLHGRALMLSGDVESALGAFREATAQLPVQPVAFERLATAAELAGRAAEARDALVRYLALLPDGRRQAVVAARIADVSARLRQPAEAVRWQTRAVEENPADGRLLARLAELQITTGDRHLARTTLARAIAAGAPPEAIRRVELALQ